MRIHHAGNHAFVFLGSDEFETQIAALDLGPSLVACRELWLSQRYTEHLDRSEDDSGLFARYLLGPEVRRIAFVDAAYEHEWRSNMRRSLAELN
jgi:hypothetical protein